MLKAQGFPPAQLAIEVSPIDLLWLRLVWLIDGGISNGNIRLLLFSWHVVAILQDNWRSSAGLLASICLRIAATGVLIVHVYFERCGADRVLHISLVS